MTSPDRRRRVEPLTPPPGRFDSVMAQARSRRYQRATAACGITGVFLAGIVGGLSLGGGVTGVRDRILAVAGDAAGPAATSPAPAATSPDQSSQASVVPPTGGTASSSDTAGAGAASAADTAAATSAAPEAASSVLRGRVVDPAGAPVAGVYVWTGQATAAGGFLPDRAVTTTDAKGRYEVSCSGAPGARDVLAGEPQPRHLGHRHVGRHLRRRRPLLGAAGPAGHRAPARRRRRGPGADRRRLSRRPLPAVALAGRRPRCRGAARRSRRGRPLPDLGCARRNVGARRTRPHDERDRRGRWHGRAGRHLRLPVAAGPDPGPHDHAAAHPERDPHGPVPAARPRRPPPAARPPPAPRERPSAGARPRKDGPGTGARMPAVPHPAPPPVAVRPPASPEQLDGPARRTRGAAAGRSPRGDRPACCRAQLPARPAAAGVRTA